MVGDEKMSKSLGNFTSLTDLLERTDARAYRLLVLRSHYRSPIEVTPATIADAERALERLDSLARRFDLPSLAGDMLEEGSHYEWEGEALDLYDRVATKLDDDLDTPLAVAQLFEALGAANAAADRGDETEARILATAVNAPVRGDGAHAATPVPTTSTRPVPTWSAAATPRGRPRTGPKPTACATNW